VSNFLQCRHNKLVSVAGKLVFSRSVLSCLITPGSGFLSREYINIDNIDDIGYDKLTIVDCCNHVIGAATNKKDSSERSSRSSYFELLFVLFISLFVHRQFGRKPRIYVVPINLFYNSPTGWTPLPNWAHFFIDLGASVSTYGNARNRVVVGLALPARSYAASLVAFGVTAGKFDSANKELEAVKRFQQLCELKHNTPLFYRKKGELIRVFFDDLEEIDGETKIRLITNGARYWITPKQALQVEFPAKDFSELPKRPSRRLSAHPSRFLSSLFDTDAVTSILSQSSLDSLTIGALHQLDEEIQAWPIALKTGEEFVTGFLQDVIRVRRFSKQVDTYRSEIYHVTSKGCNNAGKEIPSVVIFEGGAGFLRWRDAWRESSWVILFDQTEAEFDIAVQAFNDEYIKSPADGRDVPGFPIIPAYIPAAAYQEVHL
jgi:hypothetical protein